MDNTIDFFRDTCNTFRITPEAEKYIYGGNKVMESLPNCVSKTFSEDWSKKVPTLKLKETIFPILKHAEDSLGLTYAGENTLMSILNIEQRFTTTEVIIITEKDNGNIIPVYNRNWLLLSAENKTKHSIITECEIPADNPDENENSLLGCYISDTGTVLLWIDRISNAANRNNMDTELLFQKVLLHELIHAILDCSKRDDKLNVYCYDDSVKGIEETLDNILVLKCYKENCNQSFFNSISRFISTQPSNYALASEVFKKIGLLWIQLEGFITIFLLCKISGKVKTKNSYMYYVVGSIEEIEESVRDIIDDAVVLTGGMIQKVSRNSYSYLQSNYDEFQSLFISDISGEGLYFKIDGERYVVSNIDFISEITARNNNPEKIIKAIIILKNLEKNDFIYMAFSFYNIDKKTYISDLSMINLSINRLKASDEGYILPKEDVMPVAGLLSVISYGVFHWTYFFCRY